MIKKSEKCLYCGGSMDSVTAKKKFCSAKCRVYYNRAKEDGRIDVPAAKVSVSNLTKPNLSPKEITASPPQSNYSINTTKKEMPKGLSLTDQIQWKIDNP